MKVFRLILFFLLSLVMVTALFSFFIATTQKVERSVTIAAPAPVVYPQIVKLENFNKWSVWSQQDSTATYTLNGTDGMVGASSAWKGHPLISGEGEIKITAAEENKYVSQSITFIKPNKASAISSFKLNEINGATTVTWIFEKITPRPWNIFNMLYNLDKEMGADFEKGLHSLKKRVEQNNADSLTTVTPLK